MNESTQQICELAQACLDRGDASQAYSLFVHACELDDSNAEAWMMRGALSGEMGDVSGALACLRRAIELQPGLADAHLMLAHILQAQGDNKGALASGRAAVAADKDFIEAWTFTGAMAGSLGQYHLAEHCCREAIRLQPDNANAHVNLGSTLQQQERYEEAEASFRKALTCQPGLIEAHFGLADMLLLLGRDDAALEAYRTASALAPNDPRALVGEAVALEHRGDLDAARQCLEPLLAGGAIDDFIANAWLQVATETGDAEQALALGERQLDKPGDGRQRINLHFALGKICDRLSRYDRAFKHYAAGNRLMGARFDAQANRAGIDQLIQCFSNEFLERAPRATERVETPVFIIGMPRSGTSLVEQILASHSQVYGAGELTDMPEMGNRLAESLGSPRGYPSCVNEVTAEVLDNLGGRYLARLAELSGGVMRVTDKMPVNFLKLGLIELLFPGARIVHCRRDPLDTCLSCYFQPFTRGYDYSYDLRYLAAYYRDYERLMDHWRTVSGLQMLEVGYEDLVSEPEIWTRRLISFLGLEWEEGCLHPHETRRAVATSSYDQVRKPIYRHSAGRWKNYRQHIQPLIDAMNA